MLPGPSGPAARGLRSRGYAAPLPRPPGRSAGKGVQGNEHPKMARNATARRSSGSADDPTWTDTAISNLRRLWDEGHSTAEIGRRLGVSKNAVVGKAHRLDLPQRPSPIRRSTHPARTPAPRPKVTLPVQMPPAASVQAAPALPLTPAPPPVPSISCRRGLSQPCCWPLGEPGRPGFRFCDAAADNGKPYCAEHRALAYKAA